MNINLTGLFLNYLPEKQPYHSSISHLLHEQGTKNFLYCGRPETQWTKQFMLGTQSDRRAGDLQSGGSLSDVEAGQISLVAWPFCHGSTSATEPNKCQDEFK